MTEWKKILIPLFTLLTLSILLFIRFALNAVSMANSVCGKADAIVAITGGQGRLEEALKLFRSGKARYLILSGVDASAALKDIFFMETWKKRRLPPGIILERRSANTYENALETKGIAEALGLKSLILVTSLYHMKRALYTFKRIIPGMKVCSYTVESKNFKREWWKDSRSIYILLTEFIKFYWYRLSLGIKGHPS